MPQMRPSTWISTPSTRSTCTTREPFDQRGQPSIAIAIVRERERERERRSRTLSRRLDLDIHAAAPRERQGLVDVVDLVHTELGGTVVLVGELALAQHLEQVDEQHAVANVGDDVGDLDATRERHLLVDPACKDLHQPNRCTPRNATKTRQSVIDRGATHARAFVAARISPYRSRSGDSSRPSLHSPPPPLPSTASSTATHLALKLRRGRHGWSSS